MSWKDKVLGLIVQHFWDPKNTPT